MQVLLVEDDLHVAALVRQVLQRDQVFVRHVWSWREAYDIAINGDFDAVVLDLKLPDGNGLDLLDALRREGLTMPVLLLTAASAVEDVVEGLDRGADDYLTKPFPVAVLAARIRALLRRHSSQSGKRLVYGDLVIERMKRSVTVGGETVKLTPTEFKLLEVLLLNRGRIVPRGELLSGVWQTNFDPGPGILHANIARLRKKLQRRGLTGVIETVRGSGYRVSPEAPTLDRRDATV